MIRYVSSVLVLSILFFSHISTAALPPMTLGELNLQASHVLEGYVFHVDEYNITSRDGREISKLFTVKMFVSRVEQGGFERNNIVQFSFWCSVKRPEGFVGPIGQSQVIQSHKTVKVWLVQKEDNTLFLLEPNGWTYSNYSTHDG